MRLQTGDRAATAGKTVLDYMPELHRSNTRVGIERGAATDQTDTVLWADQKLTLTDNIPQQVTTPAGTYTVVKSGTWLFALFPDAENNEQCARITADGFNTRNNTAYRLFRTQGMFDGHAERYDDKAEILVQLPLNEDPNLFITYTNADPGRVKVRISSVDEEGSARTETYTVSTLRYKLREPDTLVPNNEVHMPGTLSVNGETYPVPEALSNTRAAFFHNLTEALDVIDHYSVTGGDGAIYLPVGWMEREV